MNSGQRAELWQLASGAADGRLTPAQFERLEELLGNSEGARRAYVRFMTLSAGLSLAAQEPQSWLARHASIDAVTARTYERTRRWARWGAWAVAASLVFALTVPVIKSWIGTGRGSVGPTNSQGVAVLSAADNVEWSGAEEPAHVGALLMPQTLRLKSGIAQIDTFGGATVYLQGPAEFRLISPGEGYCQSGRALVLVPEKAPGFRINSPQLTIADKGTRYGMDVETHDSSEVHVFKGQVDIQRSGSAAGGGKSQRFEEGDAVSIAPDGSFQKIRANPDKFRAAYLGNGGPGFGGPMGGPPGPFGQWPGWNGGWNGGQPGYGPMGPGDSWKGHDPLAQLRTQVYSSDTQWNELEPRLEAVLHAQRLLHGNPMDPDDQVGKALWDLSSAAHDPGAADSEIARKLAAFRAARDSARAQLKGCQEQLRGDLDPREEATLINMGFLDQ